MQKQKSRPKKNSEIVYSTDPSWQEEDLDSSFEEQTKPDGTVYIGLEKKHRGGKQVTVIRGLPMTKTEEITRKLKTQCATGGTIKGDCIELQGDHRKKVAALLTPEGFKIKFTGG